MQKGRTICAKLKKLIPMHQFECNSGSYRAEGVNLALETELTMGHGTRSATGGDISLSA